MGRSGRGALFFLGGASKRVNLGAWRSRNNSLLFRRTNERRGGETSPVYANFHPGRPRPSLPCSSLPRCDFAPENISPSAGWRFLITTWERGRQTYSNDDGEDRRFAFTRLEACLTHKVPVFFETPQRTSTETRNPRGRRHTRPPLFLPPPPLF